MATRRPAGTGMAIATARARPSYVVVPAGVSGRRADGRCAACGGSRAVAGTPWCGWCLGRMSRAEAKGAMAGRQERAALDMEDWQ